MQTFNESHKRVPSSEFLKDYPDLYYILDDLDDLDYEVNEIIDCLDEANLEEDVYTIANIFESYSVFLNIFSSFYELSTAMQLLRNVLLNTNLENLDGKSRMFVSKFIVAILEDLQKWKDHVFIVQDAVDVFYINASALNSCIQLESYIKSNT